MKRIILIAGALLLVGCGPSQKEKERVAQVACSEIMATRNFEEARRIKIINEARLEVGLDPIGFLNPIYGTALFETNIRLGGKSSCIDYIIPPPPTPPKTNAQREAEEAAAIVREEFRLMLEEEERIAAAEADRKAKEKEKYIAENTKTTHLSCPSLEQDIEKDYVVDPNSEYGAGMIVETIIGPDRFALIEINKVDGDNPELNGYLRSKVHYEIKSSNPLETSYCVSNSGFKESVGGKEFCAGELESGIPTEYTYTEAESSSSYGHSTLAWGYYTYGADFFLDRVNLNASTYGPYLGNSGAKSYQYQCEVVSKDTYDQKFQEVQSKVKAAADAHRAELAERESEAPQI